MERAQYSASEALGDGRRVEIRALRPDDQADLLAAVDRTSGQSLYRCFFAVRRGFTEPEIAFFLNPDFVDHVALVAVVEESGRPVIVGGGRYRYSMTNSLTISSNVIWPILRACVAKNWLPFTRPASSLSCISVRFVSPKRSSRLVTHVGKASTITRVGLEPDR
jgi:hypothetical protein